METINCWERGSVIQRGLALEKRTKCVCVCKTFMNSFGFVIGRTWIINVLCFLYLLSTVETIDEVY